MTFNGTNTPIDLLLSKRHSFAIPTFDKLEWLDPFLEDLPMIKPALQQNIQYFDTATIQYYLLHRQRVRRATDTVSFQRTGVCMMPFSERGTAMVLYDIRRTMRKGAIVNDGWAIAFSKEKEKQFTQPILWMYTAVKGSRIKTFFGRRDLRNNDMLDDLIALITLQNAPRMLSRIIAPQSIGFLAGEGYNNETPLRIMVNHYKPALYHSYPADALSFSWIEPYVQKEFLLRHRQGCAVSVSTKKEQA